MSFDTHDLSIQVTIGITCFNARDTIERAIASAAKQTWGNVEILVVDDASTDDSAQIAGKALASLPNGRLVVRRLNGGVAATRNTLLAEASGSLIAFFDDDDESEPQRVAVQVARIHAEKQHGRPVLCFASGVRRYSNGYELRAEAIGSRERAPYGEEVAAYLLLNERRPGVFYGAGVPSCALMAEVASLRAIGGYDETLGRVEDVDMAIRMAFGGARFVGCTESLYLQHPTPGGDKTPLRNLVAELRIVEKNRDWLNERGLYRHAGDWFRFREAWFSHRYGEAALRAILLLAANPRLTIRRLRRSAPSRLSHEMAMHRWPVR